MTPASYDPDFFHLLFDVEDRHFWFRTRNALITALCRRLATRLPPGYRVLEVGCGTGNVLRFLERACAEGSVMGMDLFGEGLHYARQRSCAPLVQGDLHHPPFRHHFDMIGMFDVLEHLPDDHRVLVDLRRMLVPGGSLLLTVPAYAQLWSYFDEASHHCRRYAPADLTRKLTAAGYRVEHCTPFMMSLFPLVWLGRRLAARRGNTRPDAAQAHQLAASELRIRPLPNAVLTTTLQWEVRWLAQQRSFPFGTSLVAIATA